MGQHQYNVSGAQRAESQRQSKRPKAKTEQVVSESTVPGGITGGKVKWVMNASMADFHTIELIHSGITGRRQILFDDRPVISRKFLTKLVGVESFTFGPESDRHRAVIKIEPLYWTRYNYTLIIDGLPLSEYLTNASRRARLPGTMSRDSVTRKNWPAMSARRTEPDDVPSPAAEGHFTFLGTPDGEHQDASLGDFSEESTMSSPTRR